MDTMYAYSRDTDACYRNQWLNSVQGNYHSAHIPTTSVRCFLSTKKWFSLAFIIQIKRLLKKLNCFMENFRSSGIAIWSQIEEAPWFTKLVIAELAFRLDKGEFVDQSAIQFALTPFPSQ